MNPSSAAAPSSLRAIRPGLVATVVGVAVYIVLDIVAQLLPPHYSPIRQAESDLAVGPYGWVMDVNFVVRGLLSLTLVYGLYRAWPKTQTVPRVSLALLGAWGVGAFVLAVSPTDVSGPATVHGTVHLVTAFLAFLFAALGVVGVSRAMGRDPPWRQVGAYARPIAWLCVTALIVLAVGTGIPRVEHASFGLLERIFLGSVLLWMLIVALQLLRSAPHLERAGATSA